jgi:tetratricopeptide (TPR) repeat protein
VQAFYNLGMACEKLGESTCAENAYKTAISIKPDFDTAAAALSSLELDAGRVDDALAVARAGLAKHPGSAALHENLGVGLATKGVGQDAALAELEQAIKIAPTEPMYHLTLAHWLNAWHIRGATPHLDAAIDLAKGDLGLLASIGFEYRMAGEFDACIKTFDRAIGIKDGGEVRTERAICKVGKKDSAGALADLQAGVAAEPAYAPGHYWLAGRLALQKRYKEAVLEYTKYLELQPTGSLAAQASERLKLAQDMVLRDKGAPLPKKSK